MYYSFKGCFKIAERRIYFASCRASRDFMEGVSALVAREGLKVEEIKLCGVNYGDGPINVILETPNKAENKEVYLFQRFIDPFSERPDHYISYEILRGLIEGRITKNDISSILNLSLDPYLRKHARKKEGGVTGDLLEEIKERAISCCESFEGTSKDIDNHPEVHYRLEGLLARIIHRMEYISLMEEATVSAEGLMQYGAKRVTLVLPYLEGRSDKFGFKGEVNLSEKWAKDFKAHGIKNIITWRAHSPEQVSVYRNKRIGFVQVYEQQKQRSRFAEETANYLVEKYGPNKIREYLVVVLPDKGAEPEGIKFARTLEGILKRIPKLKHILDPNYKVPVVIMHKDRGGEISEIKEMAVDRWIYIKKGAYLSDKIIVYRDDIIDTVVTQDRSERILGILAPQGYKKKGEGTMILVVDNAVLSRPGAERLRKIKESGAMEILIAYKTIEPPIREDQFQGMIKYLDIYEPFAQAILMRENR